jgi:hypothetical protein
MSPRVVKSELTNSGTALKIKSPRLSTEGGRNLLSMHNTQDVTLSNKTIAQVKEELGRVEEILLYESFGNDHEARYELMDERSRLFRELKRRGARGY